jgi:DNA-binding HxlR family transcriptional regulator
MKVNQEPARRRSYQQACTLARTLDVVGDRWTLLIVRELMMGPKRFTDLLPGLPGIGKNLLAARLRHLESEGVVARRELPPPAASRVYELTEDGRALGPALAALGRWGVERLGPAPSGYVFRLGWAMFPLSYMANADAARGLHETYEFRVGDEAFHLTVDDGAVIPRAGPAAEPDLTVTMDEETLLGLFAGGLDPAAALTAGRVQAEGPPEVLGHALAVLTG